LGLSKLVTRSGIRLYTIEGGVYKSDNLCVLYPFKKNYVLVSQYNGLHLFDKRTREFSPVVNNLNKIYYHTIPHTDPLLLIGFNNIVTFDTLSLKFTDSFPLPIKPATRIIRDKSGNLFFANLKHLFMRAGKTYEELLPYRISSLLIDKKGYLWVGTWNNGVFRFRYKARENRVEIISKDQFLAVENVRSLFEDSKGNIWVGTRYKGVYQLIKNGVDSFSVSNYDQSKGLSSNFIKAIKEDAKGNIWIAFYQGLDKLIPRDTGFIVFNFSRINNYFAGMSELEIDEDNSIWLATGEGLAHITDGELEKIPPGPVYITKVSSPTQVYSQNTDKLTLPYRQNQLQFEFSSPSFINEKQVTYSYRLSGGSDNEWTKPSNQHIVSYASLKPGKYLFEVKIKGWNEVWGKTASFEFVISPPFWQSWWFILIGVSFVQ
jgi:ligand-binding sensor domain-containing protein